jgi:hypothetical protein
MIEKTQRVQAKIGTSGIEQKPLPQILDELSDGLNSLNDSVLAAQDAADAAQKSGDLAAKAAKKAELAATEAGDAAREAANAAVIKVKEATDRAAAKAEVAVLDAAYAKKVADKLTLDVAKLGKGFDELRDEVLNAMKENDQKIYTLASAVNLAFVTANDTFIKAVPWFKKQAK